MYESVKEDRSAVRPIPGEQPPASPPATSASLPLEPPRRAAPVPVAAAPVGDWRRILHFGGVDPARQVEALPLPAIAEVPHTVVGGRFAREGSTTPSTDLA